MQIIESALICVRCIGVHRHLLQYYYNYLQAGVGHSSYRAFIYLADALITIPLMSAPVSVVVSL